MKCDRCQEQKEIEIEREMIDLRLCKDCADTIDHTYIEVEESGEKDTFDIPLNSSIPKTPENIQKVVDDAILAFLSRHRDVGITSDEEYENYLREHSVNVSFPDNEL